MNTVSSFPTQNAPSISVEPNVSSQNVRILDTSEDSRIASNPLTTKDNSQFHPNLENSLNLKNISSSQEKNDPILSSSLGQNESVKKNQEIKVDISADSRICSTKVTTMSNSSNSQPFINNAYSFNLNTVPSIQNQNELNIAVPLFQGSPNQNVDKGILADSNNDLNKVQVNGNLQGLTNIDNAMNNIKNMNPLQHEQDTSLQSQTDPAKMQEIDTSADSRIPQFKVTTKENNH